MHLYRLFRLDQAGKFRDWMPIEARTDEEAMEMAHDLERQFDCELWRGAKYLGRIIKQRSAPNDSDPRP